MKRVLGKRSCDNYFQVIEIKNHCYISFVNRDEFDKKGDEAVPDCYVRDELVLYHAVAEDFLGVEYFENSFEITKYDKHSIIKYLQKLGFIYKKEGLW